MHNALKSSLTPFFPDPIFPQSSLAPSDEGTTMRIAVIGAGGVGGYFGGRLAAAGNDVQFLARGRHLAAMLESGLRVESANGAVSIAKPNATDDPRALQPADIVLV